MDHDHPRAAVMPAVNTRIAYLDQIRTLMVVLVVVYHALAAYSGLPTRFPVRDASFAAADVIRELLDVFMMPVLFFVAGYFAPVSLRAKGTAGFLLEKTKRLLVPWALAVFVVVPLLAYVAETASALRGVYDLGAPAIRPFWKYWIDYLASFETGLSFLPSSQSSQTVYWFISLLFVFFAVFALVAATVTRWRGAGRAAAATSSGSVSSVLALTGLLTAAGSFASLLLF